MMRRMSLWCLCVVLLAGLFSFTAAAETTAPAVTGPTTPVTDTAISLLSTDATMGDSSAVFAYTPEGALTVTALAPGATVAIECAQEIDLNTKRYLQLSVQAAVPFNLALKLSGEEYDWYPQLTGPSWYEAFQATAPAANEGVPAGDHTMALDVRHYADYNALTLREDGTATLKTVYLTLYAPGTVTVSHLKLGDAAFTTADGKSGTAATTLAPITTHNDTTKLPTKYAYYDGGDIAAIDDTVRQQESSTTPMIVLSVIGVLLVAAMVLLTILKKRRDRISLEEPSEE